MFFRAIVLCSVLLSLNWQCQPKGAEPVTKLKSYADLLNLFTAWRTFEQPPLLEGAPDYRAVTFNERRPEFERLRAQLLAMDTSGWKIQERVEWMVIWAEMNGYDFNQKVLQPWVRDPAFYKSIWTDRSDVPHHEGPTHHRVTELWTYNFPLAAEPRQKLLGDLAVIPALNAQAKINLTGQAHDLWVAGIRDIRTQASDLTDLLKRPAVAEDMELVKAIEAAITATQDLESWLEQEAPKKNGPSGIGKDHYTWYLQNVHLVPLTWEDEVMLLKRELARAWSALKLEEHNNRHLPPLEAADSPDAYQQLARRSADDLMKFLKEQEIMTIEEYFPSALDAHLGAFVPADKRNFFWIAAHYDPRPLYTHFYHWFELALLDSVPVNSPVRRVPLYNIFDSHNEGMATAVEEMFMLAGLYNEHPRVREIVYIMIAQRAARGLGSLYAHANQMTMAEAGKIHTEYTPRGWMKVEKDLMLFEQHLYLRQPGYGTSYITGKYLAENLMAEVARHDELVNRPFVLKDFFDRFNASGNIPTSLIQWELTGDDNHLKSLLK